jgi:hypothetical protein
MNGPYIAASTQAAAADDSECVVRMLRSSVWNVFARPGVPANWADWDAKLCGEMDPLFSPPAGTGKAGRSRPIE